MEVRDLRAYYETKAGPPVKAVDGVSFTLDEGEVLGIVGESGCGKSTLASVLSLGPSPTLRVHGGTLILNGEEIDLEKAGGVPRDWRGKIVSLLPQRAMNSLNPTSRVGDVAFDVMRAHDSHVSRREALKRATQRLEQLGLPPRVLYSYPHQLSGGMRQRVVTVISTLLNPTVLIADEPTSALDVSSQKALVEMLERLLKERVITRVAFITHDLTLLSNIATRIAVMYAGEIVEIGTTEQIVQRPEHPYTRALIGSTLEPERGVRQRRIEGLTGSPPDLRNPPAGCRFHPRCPYAMEICTREAPPRVGSTRHYATCWWVKQNVEAMNEGALSDTAERAAHPA